MKIACTDIVKKMQSSNFGGFLTQGCGQDCQFFQTNLHTRLSIIFNNKSFPLKPFLGPHDLRVCKI